MTALRPAVPYLYTAGGSVTLGSVSYDLSVTLGSVNLGSVNFGSVNFGVGR